MSTEEFVSKEEFEELRQKVISLEISIKDIIAMHTPKKKVAPKVVETIEEDQPTPAKTVTKKTGLTPPKQVKGSITAKKLKIPVKEITPVKNAFTKKFEDGETEFIERFHNDDTKKLEADDSTINTIKNKNTKTYRKKVAKIVWDYHFERKVPEFVSFWNKINPNYKLQTDSDENDVAEIDE